MGTPALETRLALRERPARTPVMFQRWEDLLFLHWEADPVALQRTLPPGLHVDLFHGRAYLGIVPFRMRRVRPRGLSALPWVSDFLEFNVRTYVHDESGQPGVWFYSLDCDQPLAVWIARTFFHLPYFRAALSASNEAGTIRFSSRGRTAAPAEAAFTYRRGAALETAAPGSLEFFLVERYLLYAFRAGQLQRGRVHHAPYRICRPELHTCVLNGMTPSGLPALPDCPPHALASPGVDVEIFGLEQT
jgi:uncharacterized protein YqjF (DUF2071 family)